MAELVTLRQVTESLEKCTAPLAVSETVPDVVAGSNPALATTERQRLMLLS